MIRHVHHKAGSKRFATWNIIKIREVCNVSHQLVEHHTVSLKQRQRQKLTFLNCTKSHEQTALTSYNFLTNLGISKGTVIISGNKWRDMISVRPVRLMKEREPRPFMNNVFFFFYQKVEINFSLSKFSLKSNKNLFGEIIHFTCFS